MTSPKQTHSLAYLLLAFGILCIGFSAIFVRIANVPGSVSAFYRVFLAAVILVPWWVKRGMRIPTRSDLLLVMAGSIFFALDLFLWNTSLLLTNAATATLLANNAPVWVGLISVLFLRQRLGKFFWLGLALALVGMSVLVGSEAWRMLTFNRGDVLALTASFFYALYLLNTLQARKRLDTVTFMTFSVLFSMIVLLGINLTLGTSLVGFEPRTWLALLGLGVISHFGGWISINYALGHLSASNVSAMLLMQSVVTALLAMPILGEFLSLHQVVGGIIVLAGIFVVNRRRAGS